MLEDGPQGSGAQCQSSPAAWRVLGDKLCACCCCSSPLQVVVKTDSLTYAQVSEKTVSSWWSLLVLPACAGAVVLHNLEEVAASLPNAAVNAE